MTTDEWRSSLLNRVSNLESAVGELKTTTSVDRVHRENVEKQLNKIESGQTWLFRLVMGSVITAIVAFAMSGGFFIG